jgi:SAM-dependent methyltransferase
MWDERYSRDDYLFGTEPAAFLTACADLLSPGATALAVADGEGRNSVYLAEQGLSVTAMDGSPVGVEKARRLAAERSVTVDFSVADINQWDWDGRSFDVVVAIFIQFLSPSDRPAVFAGMQRALKPGGLLLLHGYRPEQVDYGTGGPPIRENMYTEALLADAFSELNIERLESYDAAIEEGTGHVGQSALIDLVARKPGPAAG